MTGMQDQSKILKFETTQMRGKYEVRLTSMIKSLHLFFLNHAGAWKDIQTL